MFKESSIGRDQGDEINAMKSKKAERVVRGRKISGRWPVEDGDVRSHGGRER